VGKYNFGEIRKPTVEQTGGNGTWGQVRLAIFELELSDSARLLLAWADSRHPSYVPTVSDVRATFGWGKDRWRRVADELQAGGWLRQQREIESDGTARHRLDFSLMPLLELSTSAQKPQVERARDGAEPADHARCPDATPVAGDGGETGPSRDGGAARTLFSDGVGTQNRQTAPVGGGSLESSDGGLGDRLSDLLPAEAVSRVNAAAEKAAAYQVFLAEAAVRRAVRQRKVRDLVRYAVGLGKLANCGQVESAEPDRSEHGTYRQRRLTCERRAELARWWVDHHDAGRLEAAADGLGWHGPRGMIVGRDADAVWKDVETGALTLFAPESGAPNARRGGSPAPAGGGGARTASPSPPP